MPCRYEAWYPTRGSRRGVRPLGERQALQERQPHPVPGRRVQTRTEGLGEHPGVVEGVVRVFLYDAEVRGERLQLVVGQRERQLLGERDGAQPLADRGGALRACVLPGDHLPVEDGVVRHQDPAVEPFGELGRDLREERGALQDVTGQTVDPDGPGVPLRIDQRVPVVLDVSAGVEPVDGSGDYPVVAGEAGGLHVDDRVSLRVSGRPCCGCCLAVVEHGHREYGPRPTTWESRGPRPPLRARTGSAPGQ